MITYPTPAWMDSDLEMLADTAGGSVAVQPLMPASCQKRCQSWMARMSGAGAAGGVTTPR